MPSACGPKWIESIFIMNYCCFYGIVLLHWFIFYLYWQPAVHMCRWPKGSHFIAHECVYMCVCVCLENVFECTLWNRAENGKIHLDGKVSRTRSWSCSCSQRKDKAAYTLGRVYVKVYVCVSMCVCVCWAWLSLLLSMMSATMMELQLYWFSLPVIRLRYTFPAVWLRFRCHCGWQHRRHFRWLWGPPATRADTSCGRINLFKWTERAKYSFFFFFHSHLLLRWTCRCHFRSTLKWRQCGDCVESGVWHV